MGRSSSPPLLFFSIIILSSCGAAVVPTANHEFNFRGCIDSSPTADTGVDGSGITAMAMNGATCSSEGMLFDGADDYVQATPWQFGGEPLTVEALVRFSALTENARIFDFNNGNVEDNYEVFLSNKGSTMGMQWSVTNGNTASKTGKIDETVREIFPQNEWSHVVLVFEGTQVFFYHNGANQTVGTGQQPALATRIAHELGRSATGDNNFNGILAYVRFWHGTALDWRQIATLFSEVAPSPAPTRAPTTLGAACDDFVREDLTVWGKGVKGAFLGDYTDQGLQFVGCGGTGCLRAWFNCTDSSPTPGESVTFGTTAGVMRACHGVSALAGCKPLFYDEFKNDGSCCGHVGGICNAPDTQVSAAEICRALGYSSGFVDEATHGECSRPNWNGSEWSSDFLSSGRFAKTYTCTDPAPSLAPTAVPTPTPVPSLAPTGASTVTVAVALTLTAAEAPTAQEETDLKEVIEGALNSATITVKNFVITVNPLSRRRRRRRRRLSGDEVEWTVSFDVVSSDDSSSSGGSTDESTTALPLSATDLEASVAATVESDAFQSRVGTAAGDGATYTGARVTLLTRAPSLAPTLGPPSDLTITGIVAGSRRRAALIELYASAAIDDLREYGLGKAVEGGGGSGGQTFTFSQHTDGPGFMYVAQDPVDCERYFRLTPEFTAPKAANISGNDAIELFKGGIVVDVSALMNMNGQTRRLLITVHFVPFTFMLSILLKK